MRAGRYWVATNAALDRHRAFEDRYLRDTEGGGIVSGEWIVHTDGSGTTGGPAGIAFVARRDGVMIEDSLPLASATNQQAEILAATYALHRLPAGSMITVVSDSKYLVKGWNEYLPDWRSRGWRKRTGGTPKNTTHWRGLIEAAERHASVGPFSWTRAHVGTIDNERADVLAGIARQAAIAGALTLPAPVSAARPPRARKLAPWRELPPVEMAEHLLVTPTIPDTAWTQEPRLRGELRSAFIVRMLAPELAVAPEEEEEDVPREPLAG